MFIAYDIKSRINTINFNFFHDVYCLNILIMSKYNSIKFNDTIATIVKYTIIHIFLYKV
jgi:hypothetical protein